MNKNTENVRERADIKMLPFSASAHKECVTVGRFNVSRYHGKFRTRALQTRADLGNWYAYASGTGLGVTGEGATIEAAIADMRARATAMVEELKRVYSLNEATNAQR